MTDRMKSFCTSTLAAIGVILAILLLVAAVIEDQRRPRMVTCWLVGQRGREPVIHVETTVYYDSRRFTAVDGSEYTIGNDMSCVVRKL